MPLGRILMDLADIEKVCLKAPDSLVIASHLGSVNHALLDREDVCSFVNERNLSQVIVPGPGEYIEI